MEAASDTPAFRFSSASIHFIHMSVSEGTLLTISHSAAFNLSLLSLVFGRGSLSPLLLVLRFWYSCKLPLRAIEDLSISSLDFLRFFWAETSSWEVQLAAFCEPGKRGAQQKTKEGWYLLGHLTLVCSSSTNSGISACSCSHARIR
jgi:hypothetical protein